MIKVIVNKETYSEFEQTVYSVQKMSLLILIKMIKNCVFFSLEGHNIKGTVKKFYKWRIEDLHDCIYNIGYQDAIQFKCEKYTLSLSVKLKWRTKSKLI